MKLRMKWFFGTQKIAFRMKSVAKGCKIEEVVYQYKTENYLRNQNSSESTFFFVKNYDRIKQEVY